MEKKWTELTNTLDENEGKKLYARNYHQIH